MKGEYTKEAIDDGNFVLQGQSSVSHLDREEERDREQRETGFRRIYIYK